MDLKAHDGDVSLQSDDKQVGQWGREADVQKTLAEEVSIHCKLPGDTPGVKHEVHVGYACEEVRGSEVGQEIVEGEMEPPVGDDGGDDQSVGEQDEAAEQAAHHLDQNELGIVPWIISFTLVSVAVAVEEIHDLVIMTA